MSIADANFVCSWRNHLFYETATWNLASGAVTGGSLPALATTQLSDRVTIVASRETAGHAVIELRWQVGTPVPVHLFGLMNYEIRAPGASGVVIQASVLSASETGSVIDQALTPWQRPSTDYLLHLWTILDAAVADCDEIVVRIDAEFGGGGGVLTFVCGGWWAGPAWSLPAGIEASWAQPLGDTGVMRRSLGHQGYPRRGSRYRRFRGRAPKVPFEYVYGAEDDSVLDIQQLLFRVGTTEPVVFFPRTRNAAGARSAHVMHRLGIYGHFEALGEIVEDGGDQYLWTGAEVAELL